ncbi:MAG: type 4a pilus biogenesis protein PilO [Arenicellales bacterium]
MNVSELFESLQDIDYTDISSWPFALKLLGSFLIGTLIVAAIYMLFLVPKYESYEFAQTQEVKLKKEFEKKQKLAVNLPAYQQQMIEIKDRFENVLQQLPNKGEIPDLLTDISQAGVEQGLVFKQFKPSKSEQRNFYVRLPIDIEASGSYHQLAGFISAVANFQRVVTVGAFNITRNRQSKQSEDDGAPPLSFKAKIYTYHFSDTETLSNKEGGAKRVQR